MTIIWFLLKCLLKILTIAVITALPMFIYCVVMDIIENRKFREEEKEWDRLSELQKKGFDNSWTEEEITEYKTLHIKLMEYEAII